MFDDEVSRTLASDEFQRQLRRRLLRGVVVDEVLGRTWERAHDKIPAEGDHIAWLLRVATNIANDDVKAETRRKRRERQVGRGNDCNDAHNHDRTDSRRPQPRNEPTHEEMPGAALERRELRRAIANAVRTVRLPRNHRCALWAWVRGRLAEWAAGRGIPAATARVWALRAREALRPHLIVAGLGPDSP